MGPDGWRTAVFAGIHGERIIEVTRMPRRLKSNGLWQPSLTWQGDSGLGTPSFGGCKMCRRQHYHVNQSCAKRVLARSAAKPVTHYDVIVEAASVVVGDEKHG